MLHALQWTIPPYADRDLIDAFKAAGDPNHARIPRTAIVPPYVSNAFGTGD